MLANVILNVGKTISEALVWMYRLNKACEVQVMTHGSGGGYVQPSQQADEFTAKGTLDYITTYGTKGPGSEDFAAFMRLMDHTDPLVS